MGEDVGKLGGVFRVTDSLQKDLREARVFDTPLAESGIIGTAVGLAIRGYRPVCEIQFDASSTPARPDRQPGRHQMHNRSNGQLRMPITIRIPTAGASGGRAPLRIAEAYFAHTAGLKVVTCSNPSDAYWMIQQAIKSTIR